VTPIPLAWQVDGLQLAGLSWGNPAGRPLLALHGWLDNAASFSLLAPLLTDYHVVAVDLTGHGQSDCRSADATYQIWDDLPQLVGVVDALGWQRFALMGHSRGAIIATLLASALPERVTKLVLLDGVAPQAVPEQEFARQLRKFLDDRRRWSGRNNRVYPDLESALASRDDGSLHRDALRLIVQRNLRSCAGGYTWTTDLRLRGASAVKLSEGHLQAVHARLSMPTLLLLAEGGFGRHAEIAERAQRQIPDLDIRSVAGGHHFHMESGAAKVADEISGFLGQDE
jgi:pimeloyl-ACP methyl ester carboxylesterase